MRTLWQELISRNTLLEDIPVLRIALRSTNPMDVSAKSKSPRKHTVVVYS